MRPRAIYPFLGCLVLALGLRSAHAAPDLATDSPFALPGGATAPAAVTEGAPIELHGIMVMSDGMRFSIYDTVKKSSQWVRVNQSGVPFVVRAHNMVDGNDEIKVDYQGSSLTLALKTPKITAMARPPAGPVMQIPGQFNRVTTLPSPITQTVVVNPTPADEAARLQAVVDAVAARRAARNQAIQQQGQPPNAQVNPANTMQQQGGTQNNQRSGNRQRPQQR